MTHLTHIIRYILLPFLFCSVLFSSGCKNKSFNDTKPIPRLEEYNKLVWADEFNNLDIDTSCWQYSDAHYWKHEEIQEFNKSKKNGFIRDGKLIIRALKEHHSISKAPYYTSACITTKNRMKIKYGRIDVKARMPFGKGLMAAITMKPCHDSLTGKNMADAIDIAIVKGDRTRMIMSSVRYFDNQNIERSNGDWHSIEYEEDYARTFHTFSLVHEPGELWFYANGKLFFHVSDDFLAPSEYPFDTVLFLNFHVSVGGKWAGEPDSLLTAFPQEMEIEYVRFFKRPEEGNQSITIRKKNFPDIHEYEKLIWQDEFGDKRISSEYWTHETGDNWWNGEIQGYTDDSTNSYIENGQLVISAIKTPAHVQSIRNYTSARLVTKEKVSFGFGRVDFRLKLDHGDGIWPAAWFLPNNDKYGAWPASGEIDVLEIFGADSLTLSMAAHFGSNRNDHHARGAKMFYDEGFDDQFHIFTLIREKDSIWWYFDGKPCFHLSKELCLPHHYPFNEEFYAILNVAVGGSTAGYPKKTTTFPKKMYVDYVRYYTK